LRFYLLNKKNKNLLACHGTRFNDLITIGPDLAIQDPVLLQHFYMGLNRHFMNFLDMAFRGAFLHSSASKPRTILDKIIGRIPYTSIHNELLEEEKESSPDQEEKVFVAKSQPF